MSTAPITFICGSDDFLVGRQARKVWDQLCKDVSDPHACEIVDGQAGNAEEVELAVTRFASAVQTMSLFGDRKAVWLRSVSFMGDSGAGRSETAKAQVERLQGILEHIDPAGVSVLITASPVDRRRKSFKWMQANSEFSFLEESKDDSALVPALQEEAASFKCKLTDSAARVLLGKINGNSRLALEEIRKMATWLGEKGGPIDEKLINELVPSFGEGDYFEAVEAFFARNLPWTLDALRRHFFAGNDARPLITSIQNRNRLLIQLKVLQEERALGPRINQAALSQAKARFGEDWGQADAKSSFNLFTQHPFYLSRLGDNAGKFSLKELVRNQVDCLEAFRQLLERPNDAEGVLRELALKSLS